MRHFDIKYDEHDASRAVVSFGGGLTATFAKGPSGEITCIDTESSEHLPSGETPESRIGPDLMRQALKRATDMLGAKSGSTLMSPREYEKAQKLMAEEVVRRREQELLELRQETNELTHPVDGDL